MTTPLANGYSKTHFKQCRTLGLTVQTGERRQRENVEEYIDVTQLEQVFEPCASHINI